MLLCAAKMLLLISTPVCRWGWSGVEPHRLSSLRRARLLRAIRFSCSPHSLSAARQFNWATELERDSRITPRVNVCVIKLSKQKEAYFHSYIIQTTCLMWWRLCRTGKKARGVYALGNEFIGLMALQDIVVLLLLPVCCISIFRLSVWYTNKLTEVQTFPTEPWINMSNSSSWKEHSQGSEIASVSVCIQSFASLMKLSVANQSKWQHGVLL